jgi:hypothetical protein
VASTLRAVSYNEAKPTLPILSGPQFAQIISLLLVSCVELGYAREN